MKLKKLTALLLAALLVLSLAACGAKDSDKAADMSGDNAAMIGIPALRSYLAGNFAELTLDAAPNAPLGTWSTPDAPVPPVWNRE